MFVKPGIDIQEQGKPNIILIYAAFEPAKSRIRMSETEISESERMWWKIFFRSMRLKLG